MSYFFKFTVISSSMFIYIWYQVFIVAVISYVVPNWKLLESNQRQSTQIHLFNRFFGNSGKQNNEFDALPIAVIVCGLKDHELETIDDVMFNVTSKVSPVIILNNGKDFEISLSDILLSERFLQIRDHELPENPLVLEYPFVIISGCKQKETLDIVQLLKYAHKNNNKVFPKCLFAVAVKPALNKPMKQLLEEIVQDYRMTSSEGINSDAQRGSKIV